jgi:histidyl-tRNA synthetase
VRAYFERRLNQEPQPSRLYLMGPMFRYDRPQKGRYRQFYQLDVEAIGSASGALDAEVIELARDWLREVGLGDLRLELNSIGDSKCRPDYLKRLQDYYRPLKSKLSPESQQRLERNPLRLLDSKAEEDAPHKSDAPRITDHLCEECAAHWVLVQRLLDAAEIDYVLNPYLVRGLDYYTRTVFEFFPGGATGQQDALGGGGRYDGLAEAEGWPVTPAVGFASGLDRVTELMAAQRQEVIPSPPSDVLVIADSELYVEAASVARICRAVRSVAVDYEPKSLRAKMRAANKVGAKWVVLLSADEVARQTAQLKEMASGEQVEVAWADLPGKLA